MKFPENCVVVCTLSTAVWLRKNEKLGKDTILDICASIELRDPKVTLPRKRDAERLEEQILEVCQALQEGLTADRVFAPYEAQVFSQFSNVVRDTSSISAQIVKEDLIGRASTLLNRLESDYDRVLEFVKNFVSCVGSSYIKNACDVLEYALILLDFIKGLLTDSIMMVVTACIRFEIGRASCRERV